MKFSTHNLGRKILGIVIHSDSVQLFLIKRVFAMRRSSE